MTTPTTTRSSAADGLRAYGLAGIELQRAAERRQLTASPRAATARTTGLLYRLRQASGDAIIRLGAAIAGNTSRPAARPTIHPKVDMA